MRFVALLLATSALLRAHAPILPAIRGPLRTQGNRLIDGNGETTVLHGATLPNLDATAATYGVIRIRWNLNTVRLPVQVAEWKTGGARYLDRVAEAVRLANAAELIAVLAAQQTGGLPDDDTLAFWRECAARFQSNPRVVFSLFHEPSAASIPGATDTQRTTNDWRYWAQGGIVALGRRVVGMQALTDAIRGTGASQLIAAPAFHDRLGFQNLPAEYRITSGNILYEAHPGYEFGITDAARQALFGALGSSVPFYAGAWGLRLQDSGPACTNIPREIEQANRVVFDTANYFDQRGISWTASTFEPGSLINDTTDYSPTTLDRPWVCGAVTSPAATPPAGMGEALLFITTGDATGFGYLGPDRLANSAGGPATPVAPGQLLSVFVEQLGPSPGVATQFDTSRHLPPTVDGVEVRFDGVPAPLLYAGQFQINLQVPYTLVPGTKTTLQVWYRGVPSSRATVDVVDASPELFHDPATRAAIALNEDGSRNTPSNPAAPGSIVVLYASGGGQTIPPGTAGLAAPSPHPRLALPATVTVDSQPASVLFAGEVPGFTGLVQVNAQLPLSITAAAVPRPVPVTLRIGSRASRASVLLWIR